MPRKPFLPLEHHYRGQNPLRTLLYLFSPHRWRLAVSMFFFVCKQSPTWVTPILFADIIILDEATSALDVISEKLVQEAVTRLIHGRTTFIVAHRLSTIRNASRVIVLRDGRLAEAGRHDDLARAGGEFAKLKAWQV